MNIFRLVLFACLWTGVVYGYNCLLARRILAIDPARAGIYFMAVALIGVSGEIFLDTVYKSVVGTPLWEYKILPVHGGYTSYFAPVIWGIYGFHLYLFHGLLDRWNVRGLLKRTLIFSFEALLFEALLTLSARPLLGDYMYYYFPSDLWHVTSVQNMPFYFICGLLIFRTVERFKKDPQFFSLMSASLMVVIIFMT
jgi:hypothetical protein